MKVKSSSINAIAIGLLLLNILLPLEVRAESTKCPDIFDKLDQWTSEASHKLQADGWIDPDYYATIAKLEHICNALCDQTQCQQAVPMTLMTDKMIAAMRKEFAKKD